MCYLVNSVGSLHVFIIKSVSGKPIDFCFLHARAFERGFKLLRNGRVLDVKLNAARWSLKGSCLKPFGELHGVVIIRARNVLCVLEGYAFEP